MSAKAPLCRERALEIYLSVAAKHSEIRASNCFLEKIEDKQIIVLRAQCEATAIHDDAVAAPYFFCDTRRSNLQLGPAIAGANRYKAADFFNQAGEHGSRKTKNTSGHRGLCRATQML